MSFKHSRYSNNNQNWLFFHPTVGDNWTNLIEKECWTENKNELEKEEIDLESDCPNEIKTGQKLVILGITSSILLIGIVALIQIPRLQEVNINITKKFPGINPIVDSRMTYLESAE